jgi:hypothetical protein
VHAAVGLAAGELLLYATLIPAAISDFLQLRRRWQKAHDPAADCPDRKRQAGDRPGQGSEPARQHANHDQGLRIREPGGSDPVCRLLSGAPGKDAGETSRGVPSSQVRGQAMVRLAAARRIRADRQALPVAR